MEAIEIKLYNKQEATTNLMSYRFNELEEAFNNNEWDEYDVQGMLDIFALCFLGSKYRAEFARIVYDLLLNADVRYQDDDDKRAIKKAIMLIEKFRKENSENYPF